MYTPMIISAMAVDSVTKTPIVVLREIDGERTLPIWIGLLEADAIAAELEGIKFSRPMTHDLLKNLLGLLDVRVKRVEVCELKNNTYFAKIFIIHKGKEITLDARPSDALALSLRTEAPIYVAEEIIDRSVQIDLQAEAEDQSEEGKVWQEILEKMDPDDFGNT